MIKPLLQNQAFLDNIEEASLISAGFHLWWLGQSGFLIQWQNKHLLLDPYLSDSLTEKYAGTDKPHVRMTELVIRPEQLDFIDVVTSSHNHTDHLDGQTLIPLIRVNPDIEMVIPRANRDFVVNRINCDPDWPIVLNEGESITLQSGFRIHGIPAAHNELTRNEDGNCHYMGYVIQFGSYSIYHSGDTLLRDEIVNALKLFEIDVAILPINGNLLERRVAGNLNAREAVRLARTIGAGILIPCHYHMFTFNTVEPDEFIQMAKAERQPIKVMSSGERFSFIR